MLQAATIQISSNPQDDPFLPVEVNGSTVEILIDSGATISTVKSDEHVCTATNNFVTTVGVSASRRYRRTTLYICVYIFYKSPSLCKRNKFWD